MIQENVKATALLEDASLDEKIGLSSRLTLM
jgi:hypothetical protein